MADIQDRHPRLTALLNTASRTEPSQPVFTHEFAGEITAVSIELSNDVPIQALALAMRYDANARRILLDEVLQSLSPQVRDRVRHDLIVWREFTSSLRSGNGNHDKNTKGKLTDALSSVSSKDISLNLGDLRALSATIEENDSIDSSNPLVKAVSNNSRMTEHRLLLLSAAFPPVQIQQSS